MSGSSEYKGIPYAVPNTDDGQWRWIIYAVPGGKNLVALNAQPRPIYPTREEAVQAVKHVIDEGLNPKPKSKG